MASRRCKSGDWGYGVVRQCHVRSADGCKRGWARVTSKVEAASDSHLKLKTQEKVYAEQGTMILEDEEVLFFCGRPLDELRRACEQLVKPGSTSTCS